MIEILTLLFCFYGVFSDIFQVGNKLGGLKLCQSEKMLAYRQN